MQALQRRIRAAPLDFRQRLVESELYLPWSAQGLRGEIFATCEVLAERPGEGGMLLRVRGEPEALKRLREQLGSTIAPG